MAPLDVLHFYVDSMTATCHRSLLCSRSIRLGTGPNNFHRDINFYRLDAVGNSQYDNPG
jgi:hypothetical protein